ncbi:MAG: aminopeptidase [bacterium]|nr:aminopeptidase [bacterium]
MPIDLTRPARTAVRQCLGISPGETVLVVTDPPCAEVAEALWQAAREAGAETLMLRLAPRRVHGEEPPALVAEAMSQAEASFLVTSCSLTHTSARRRASAAGARLATMPNITPDIFTRALDADYGPIRDLTLRVGEILERSSEARVTSPAGTDLTLNLAGRAAVLDTGIYTEPGSFGNLPAGEAYIAPVEGTAEGLVVVDGSMAGVGSLDAPIRIEVRAGRARSVYGGRGARELDAILAQQGDDARNLGELGIGTNGKARIIGHILEDEKVLGTVHVALGANASFGGMVQVACHLDGILKAPSLWVDGRQIMRDGDLLV